MTHFTKMHGNGNDFIVIDGINQKIKLNKNIIKKLSDRRTGIGFDQCLIVEKPQFHDHDFTYRIYNNDGEEVAQCGNGARALASFLLKKKLTNKNTIKLKTLSRIIIASINQDNSITVNMGKPELNPTSIPLSLTADNNIYTVKIGNNNISFMAVNVGNPHAIILTDNLMHQDFVEVSKALSTHFSFPEQTNVSFMKILNPEHIELRTYERGVGETQSCGSAAVAAAAVGILYHNLNNTIKVTSSGGNLTVTWPSVSDEIFLNGFVEFVFEGVIPAYV